MEAMAAAGAPFEAILIAVRALEAKDAEIAKRDAEAAEKRAKDAERKRSEREHSRVHGQSTDSPRTVHGQSTPPSLSLPPNENNSNPPTHTHPDNKPARVKGPDKPDGVSDQIWRDFLDLRRRKRAPLTATALRGIAAEAGKARWPLERALAEAVMRGWQSFKADWVCEIRPPGQHEGIGV